MYRDETLTVNRPSRRDSDSPPSTFLKFMAVAAWKAERLDREYPVGISGDTQVRQIVYMGRDTRKPWFCNGYLGRLKAPYTRTLGESPQKQDQRPASTHPLNITQTKGQQTPINKHYRCGEDDQRKIQILNEYSSMESQQRGPVTGQGIEEKVTTWNR